MIISCTPIHRYARLPDTIAALIVDSAPVMADPRSVASVVEASTPPGWRRWLLARYIAASARLRGVDGGMQAYLANLRRLGWGKPQLFLYSRDDPIARADKVGACVDCSRGRASWHAGKSAEDINLVAAVDKCRMAIFFRFLLPSFLADRPAG